MASVRERQFGGWQWNFKEAEKNRHARNHGSGNQEGMRKGFSPNLKSIEALATSIYITNFPKDWNERSIWKHCQEFGIVVDVYLSGKLSKVGKKFAFVRFLRVQNVNSLVEQLSGTWYGSYHLFASVARFPRKAVKSNVPMKPSVNNQKDRGDRMHATPNHSVDHDGSYVSILKRGQENQALPEKLVPNPIPTKSGGVTLVAADLIPIPDSATIVMGKVKDLSFIQNISLVLKKEGFQNVEVTHVGGSWVWIEFNNRNACTRFKQRDDLAQYFSSIQNLSRQFVVDDKVVWIEISGMPLGAWSLNAFKKGVMQWGEVVCMDNSGAGGICNGRMCLRVSRKVNIQGTTTIYLDGINHEVNVKEIGSWLPARVATADDSDQSSDGDGGEAENVDELGNSNTESDLDSPIVETDAEEEGETANEEEACVHKKFFYPPLASASKQHSPSRWADEVDLDEENLRERETATRNLNDTTPEGEGSGDFGKLQEHEQIFKDRFEHPDLWRSPLLLSRVFLPTASATDFAVFPATSTSFPNTLITRQSNASCGGSRTSDETELAEERTEDHGTTSSQPRRSDRGEGSGDFGKLQEHEQIFKDTQGLEVKLKKIEVFKESCPDYESLARGPRGVYWDGTSLREIELLIERWGCEFSHREALDFHSFIENANLVEVTMGGYAFTRLSPTGDKMSKIDRFLGTEGVFAKFPNLSSVALPNTVSDHRLICLKELVLDYGPTPFRFFNSWMNEASFEQVLLESWGAPVGEEGAAVRLKNKLKRLKVALKSWWKTTNSDRVKKKGELVKKMQEIDGELDQGKATTELITLRNEIREQLFSLEKKEMLDLAQKAKVKWSVEGDENSKFYHGFLNRKRRQVAIKGIKMDGEWISDPGKLDQEFISKAVTREEIKLAVWKCGSDKASGRDGFTFCFIKHYWEVLKEDICCFVEEFFSEAFLPVGCNSSFITLIPKVMNLMGVSDFRPISLIGIQYKIVAKVLAIRLAAVVDSVVGMEQTTFIKGRQILDGPLMVNELVQWFKKRKKKMMLLKIDFEKAYDSLSWEFLDRVMGVMAFLTPWRAWIKTCLNSSRSSVLINGSPTKEFCLHRGLRQGDPLSHFLFILVLEGLHVAMEDATDAGLFFSLRVGAANLKLSHLFYADDALFLGEWSKRNVENLYDEVEGLAMIVGCKPDKFSFSYLGLPVGDNMARLKSWDRLVQKFRNKLANWKVNTLSIGGRSLLVKSVLGGVGIYFLSLFVMPVAITKMLEAIRSKFFWDGSEKEDKMAWVKWDQVLAKRENGGLEIGSLVSFNIALILKWNGGGFFSHSKRVVDGWSPWSRVLAVDAKMHVSDIIPEHTLWRQVGDGRDTLFWDDCWIGGQPLSVRFPRLVALALKRDGSVADYWGGIGWRWGWRRPLTGRSLDMFVEMESQLCEIRCNDFKDKWKWRLGVDGSFTVGETRRWIEDRILPVGEVQSRWCGNVPRKVNILVWRVRLNRLPTRLTLSGKWLEISSILCPVCGLNAESVAHLFRRCVVAVQRWLQVVPPISLLPEDIFAWVDVVRIGFSKEERFNPTKRGLQRQAKTCGFYIDVNFKVLPATRNMSNG
ncbi:hypothetical protein LXL04_032014 [Taraxacum kok-saghyz]